MRVKCARDNTTFEAKPKPHTTSRDMAEGDNFFYPAEVINCPTCGRGYFKQTDGKWMSDRELIIL